MSHRSLGIFQTSPGVEEAYEAGICKDGNSTRGGGGDQIRIRTRFRDMIIFLLPAFPDTYFQGYKAWYVA